MNLTEMKKLLSEAIKDVNWQSVFVTAGAAVALVADTDMSPAGKFEKARELVNKQIPMGTPKHIVNLAIEIAYTIYKYRNVAQATDPTPITDKE